LDERVRLLRAVLEGDIKELLKDRTSEEITGLEDPKDRGLVEGVLKEGIGRTTSEFASQRDTEEENLGLPKEILSTEQAKVTRKKTVPKPKLDDMVNDNLNSSPSKKSIEKDSHFEKHHNNDGMDFKFKSMAGSTVDKVKDKIKLKSKSSGDKKLAGLPEKDLDFEKHHNIDDKVLKIKSKAGSSVDKTKGKIKLKNKSSEDKK